MRLHQLRIEGRDDIAWPAPQLVRELVHSFGLPNGPTYVILTGPDDQYVQAAGSSGRFVLESRDQYGEGFLHLRAGTLTGRKATVGYRRRCPKGIHPPNGCPLEVDEGCVLGLDVVRGALLHYARAGTRHPGVTWNDVTAEYQDHEEADVEIRDIRPRPAAP